MKEEHSYPLVVGLAPVVDVIHIQKKLLGKPYTACNNLASYSIEECAYSKLMRQIVDVCNCFPSYIRDGAQLISHSESLVECSFYKHATCVTYIKVFLRGTIGFDPQIFPIWRSHTVGRQTKIFPSLIVH